MSNKTGTRKFCSKLLLKVHWIKFVFRSVYGVYAYRLDGYKTA